MRQRRRRMQWRRNVHTCWRVRRTQIRYYLIFVGYCGSSLALSERCDEMCVNVRSIFTNAQKVVPIQCPALCIVFSKIEISNIDSADEHMNVVKNAFHRWPIINVPSHIRSSAQRWRTKRNKKMKRTWSCALILTTIAIYNRAQMWAGLARSPSSNCLRSHSIDRRQYIHRNQRTHTHEWTNSLRNE